jgi:hypothetical protein
MQDSIINNGWKNFTEFINKANECCNWLVLRNFEYLPNDFFENDKDVDILCDDIDQFVKIMKLRKRSWGIGAYETVIDGKIVPFDIRFIGDGYYDKLWQYKMLQNKIYTKDNVPRMNDEDYFYSLIYHSKIQKYVVKDIYIDRLYNLSKILSIKDYDTASISNDKFIANILNKFMKKNLYIYVQPLDINIPKNYNFFNLLSSDIREGLKYKTPKKVIVRNLIPNFIFKLIPKTIKKQLKKVF